MSVWGLPRRNDAHGVARSVRRLRTTAPFSSFHVEPYGHGGVRRDDRAANSRSRGSLTHARDAMFPVKPLLRQAPRRTSMRRREERMTGSPVASHRASERAEDESGFPVKRSGHER